MAKAATTAGGGGKAAAARGKGKAAPPPATGDNIEVMVKTSALEMGLALARALRSLEPKLKDALDEVNLDKVIATLEAHAGAERAAHGKAAKPSAGAKAAAAASDDGGNGAGQPAGAAARHGSTIPLPFTFRLMCNGGGDGGNGGGE